MRKFLGPVLHGKVLAQSVNFHSLNKNITLQNREKESSYSFYDAFLRVQSIV